MKPVIQKELDGLQRQIDDLRARLVGPYDPTALSGTIDARFVQLSGTIGASLVSLSGTIDAEFSYASGTLNNISGTIDARIVTLSGSIDGHFNQLSGTINAKFASGYRLLNVQKFTGSMIYTATVGTIAVHGTVVASGGGGGAGTTTAGAAGGGGGSGEWLDFWYAPGTPVTGQFVNIGAASAGGSIGSTSGIMIDGITFAALGGNAGNASTAVASYAEADAAILGTTGSTVYDLFRGSNPSVAAMATSTTTISAYTAGIGGGTPYGRGGRGSGGDTVGGDGTGYGAGGGGGRRGGATNRLGGSGSIGVVILREYGR